MNINIEVDESKIKKIGTIRVDLKETKQIGKIDIPVIKGDNGKDGANGKDGKDGQNGANGKDGTSIVSVEQIVESTESNGINQIEVKLSNGESSIFNVRNGKEGKSGGGGTDYDDSELRRLIDKKVDKETGKSLIEDTEIERLSKVKNYDDTELRGLIEETLQDAKDYTDTEIANFDFVKIVNSLPDVGLPNKVYFVPKEESETNNIFEEYAWINGAWEYFGTKTVEVDLTDVNAQLENLSKNKADKTSIPTKTSDLENDSGFITEEDVPESGTIPTGSIIGWQGDTIPEGYEEVENTNDIYSTEEQVIGTWINGKPLYRKVASVTLINKNGDYTTGEFVCGTIDVGTVLCSFCSGSVPMANSGFSSIDKNQTLVFLDKTGYLMGYTLRDDLNNKTFYAVCLYTKTTD